MALGVVHGAEDKGFVIPDDFEVITSDNTRLALMVTSTANNDCSTFI